MSGSLVVGRRQAVDALSVLAGRYRRAREISDLDWDIFLSDLQTLTDNSFDYASLGTALTTAKGDVRSNGEPRHRRAVNTERAE